MWFHQPQYTDRRLPYISAPDWVIKGKKFILGSLNLFASVDLEGGLQSDGGTGSGNVQAVELRFVQGISQLDENRADISRVRCGG